MSGHPAGRKELISLLRAAVDGIDGYDCETGDLRRYWDEVAVKRARAVLRAEPGECARRHARAYEAHTPRRP